MNGALFLPATRQIGGYGPCKDWVLRRRSKRSSKRGREGWPGDAIERGSDLHYCPSHGKLRLTCLLI